jgi:hypothetical protein
MLDMPTVITVTVNILGMIFHWSYGSLLLYYNPNVAWRSEFCAKRDLFELLISFLFRTQKVVVNYHTALNHGEKTTPNEAI